MNVELKNVSKQFRQVIVLNNVSFTFKESTIYGVVGPNGIGKTTLFKSITGLTDIDSGEILINKASVSTQQREAVVSHVSYLLSTGVIQHLTGWQNVQIFAQLYRIPQNKMENLFTEFDLQKAKHQKVKTYSLGMKQRLALIIALLHIKRKIIILDEPYLGLDPIGIQSLNIKLLNLKNQGYTILVSNHQLHESEKIFDTVLFLTPSGMLHHDLEKGEKIDKRSLLDMFEDVYIEGGTNA